MIKIMSYLKKSIFPMIIILGLLIGQAACDLSLPDFNSKIVNIGIQQGGIKNATPTKIRKGEMDKLILFMTNQDKETILSHYNQTKNSSEEVYELKSDYKNDKKELLATDAIFAKPMLITGGIESGSKEVLAMANKLKEGMPKEMQSQDLSVFEIMKMMPENQRIEMVKQINEQFKEMPDSIVSQSAIAYTKNEYQKVGIDTKKMQTQYIVTAGMKMLGIALLSMGAAILVGFLASRVAATLGKDLRGGVFKKVISFSNTEMDKFSTATLITRSTNDIQQVQMLMVMLLRMVFYAPILCVGGIIKVLGTNTKMAWIIAVAVMAILSIVLVVYALAMPKVKILQKLIDKLNLITREILTGIPVIRAFSKQKHEEKRFDDANSELKKVNLFANRIMICMMPMMMFVMNLITILIVWKGAHGINDGQMQVGDLMAFIQYTMQIIMSFLMLSMVSVMIPRAAVSVTRISEVLKTDSVINDPKTPKKLPNEEQKGYVEFKDVSFAYPNAEEDVISDISFVAKPNETTAFIGSTGSGKSTLVNLIPRFYDVTKGEILVGGVNVKEMSQNELRGKLGYVPQKGVLFSGTIESNIKFGGKQTSDETMKLAAQISQSTNFIEEKTDKYNEPISQGGTNVSGGQKQRLSIARAIAKQPDIYIFDDSFSALDYQTDVALRQALKTQTASSTVLIVAQRISTILQADQIIVLDEGKIVGRGTHKELLKSSDVYLQIAQSQLSKEELDYE